MEGLLLGLMIGFSIGLATGPTFFVLLSSTVKGGKGSGLFAAAGIVDSDLIMALLSLIGVGFLNSLQKYQSWFAWVGGCIMIAAGIAPFFFKSRFNRWEGDKIRSNLRLYAYTFVVNVINPLNWLFWMAVCGWIQIRGGGDLWWWVLVPAFFLEFALNVMKVYAIARWGRVILVAKVKWLKIIVSFSMVSLGTYLIIRGLLGVLKF